MAAFGRKHETVKSKPTSFETHSGNREKTSVVGKTLLIKGEMFSDEEVLIEGTIEGNLNINNRVVVGKNGVVNADIDAREVVIKGEVNGNVKGQFKVEIVPDGILNGNIISQRVVLAEGAVFKGNIDMTPRDDKSSETVVLESSQ
jgi:cytoskeletal protein CcmA (bactofilin family)